MLHRDVISPGIQENLEHPEILKELFITKAEEMNTVYALYFTMLSKIDHIIKIFRPYFNSITNAAGLDLGR